VRVTCSCSVYVLHDVSVLKCLKAPLSCYTICDKCISDLLPRRQDQQESKSAANPVSDETGHEQKARVPLEDPKKTTSSSIDRPCRCILDIAAVRYFALSVSEAIAFQRALDSGDGPGDDTAPKSESADAERKNAATSASGCVLEYIGESSLT